MMEKFSSNHPLMLDPLERATITSPEDGKIHESVFRSWAILDVVLWLLEQETPSDVIHAYITEMRLMNHKELKR